MMCGECSVFLPLLLGNLPSSSRGVVELGAVAERVPLALCFALSSALCTVFLVSV